MKVYWRVFSLPEALEIASKGLTHPCQYVMPLSPYSETEPKGSYPGAYRFEISVPKSSIRGVEPDLGAVVQGPIPPEWIRLVEEEL